MNDETAMACLMVASRGRGANQRATGMIIARALDTRRNDDGCAGSRAAGGDTACAALISFSFGSSYLSTLFGQDLAPFLHGGAPHAFRRFRDGREFVNPLVGAAAVDDRARAVPFLAFRNDRVERTAPAPADDLD